MIDFSLGKSSFSTKKHFQLLIKSKVTHWKFSLETFRNSIQFDSISSENWLTFWLFFFGRLISLRCTLLSIASNESMKLINIYRGFSSSNHPNYRFQFQLLKFVLSVLSLHCNLEISVHFQCMKMRKKSIKKLWRNSPFTAVTMNSSLQMSISFGASRNDSFSFQDRSLQCGAMADGKSTTF